MGPNISNMLSMWLAIAAFLATSVQCNTVQINTNHNAPAVTWSGTTIQQLWGEYNNIFRHGNRNAASHLWSAFLMDHAATMPLDRYNQLSAGYCAVSGSPVTPQQRTRYRMTLDSVTGGRVTGIVYYCCWPCVCDTQDFIKVDTKTVRTLQGASTHRFMVVGNPCANKEKIPREAPEVRCDQHGGLIGAQMSDHGYVILAKFFEDDGSNAMDHSTFDGHCEHRKQMGYNSGMGEIFRKVAAIHPVITSPSLAYGAESNKNEL